MSELSARLSEGRPGYPEHLLVSAFVDGELTALERRLASAHLAACVSCRSAVEDVRETDTALRSLPTRSPSPRIDAYVAGLADRNARGPARRVRLGWAMPRALIAVAAVGAVLLSTLSPAAPQSSPEPDTALVASVQQQVFNPKTNTLYVLDADRGEVAALDASTRLEQARIVVGGRPSALALNEPANRILVLDGVLKRLTEIDTLNNTVVSAGAVAISGTPTSMRIDPLGRIVVSSVIAAAVTPSGGPQANQTGQVTVLDSTSKQVESVRSVDVAPQSVVFDPSGKRALLLSVGGTTVADAATYRAIEHLPAGVAATFDASGRRIAIVSSGSDSAALAIFDDTGSVSVPIAGVPVSVIALPDGAFGVLFRMAGGGRIAVIGPDAKLRSTLEVPATATEIRFDSAAARFAVIGGGAVGYAALGATDVAVRPVAPAQSTLPTPNPSPSVTPSQSPSASPAILPPLPAPAPAGAVGTGPAGSKLAWSGVYRLDVPGSRKALRAAGSGGRIWIVDQLMELAAIDTETGAVSIAASLPANWTVGDLLVTDRLVVAIDPALGRVATYDRTLERFDVFDFAFAQSARSFAIAPDDRLWMAAPQGGTLIALDLRARRAEAVDTGSTGISAIAVDSGGRVSYADAVRHVLGTYDGGSHRLTEVPITRLGRITALATDASGSRWAGTDAGELIVQRADGTSMLTFAPGPVRMLAVDPAGVTWFESGTPAGVAFGLTTQVTQAQLGPSSLTGLGFDRRGGTWAADPRDAVFYIVKSAR